MIEVALKLSIYSLFLESRETVSKFTLVKEVLTCLCIINARYMNYLLSSDSTITIASGSLKEKPITTNQNICIFCY